MTPCSASFRPGRIHRSMPLLAIETTCDETAAAIITRDRTVLSIDLGDGVVDTIAFDRSHNDHRTRLTFERSGKTAP